MAVFLGRPLLDQLYLLLAQAFCIVFDYIHSYLLELALLLKELCLELAQAI